MKEGSTQRASSFLPGRNVHMKFHYEADTTILFHYCFCRAAFPLPPRSSNLFCCKLMDGNDDSCGKASPTCYIKKQHYSISQNLIEFNRF